MIRTSSRWASVAWLSAVLLCFGCGPDEPGSEVGGGAAGGGGGAGGSEGEGGTGGEEPRPGAGEIAEVLVVPDEVILSDRDSIRLEARVVDRYGDPVDAEVSWSSENPEIAEVDSSGLVSAQADGVTTIIASAGKAQGSARVEVDRIPPARIEIEPPPNLSIVNGTVTVHVDLPYEFTARLWDAYDNPLESRRVQWSIEPLEPDEGEEPREVGVVGEGGALVAKWPGKHRLVAAAGEISSSFGIDAVIRFREVAPGNGQTCALSTGDRAWCWGNNEVNQLGIGEFSGNAPINERPLRVVGDHAFATITSGRRHSCALDFEGMAWCWGRAFDGEIDGRGQSAPGKGVAAWRPMRVEVIEEPLVSIRARGTSTCALGVSGSLYCWGSIALPWSLGTFGEAMDFDMGWRGDFVCYRSVGVLADEVYCFGENGLGQVGAPHDPSFSHSRKHPSPEVFGAGDFLSVATGFDHACASLTSAGEDVTVCWGNPWTGPDDQEAELVRSSTSLTQLGSGEGFTCGLRGGEVYCWGETVPWIASEDPIHVPFPQPVATLSVGQRMICGLTDEPSPLLYCLGRNEFGELGSAVGDRDTPVRVNDQ